MANTNYLSALRNKAREMANGCPLMDGRSKGNADGHVNETLTVNDAYKLTGDNGDYYAFIVKEYDDVFFLSGGALTAIFDVANATAEKDGVPMKDVVNGLEFSFGEKRKTKNGRDFRPVHIF